ncbi:MAG: 3D domain-containing protein [Candidatus Pacebacteria bacterium]|nr:3D domain-containing protein [Candidatus Paceibacterota bacterium]
MLNKQNLSIILIAAIVFSFSALVLTIDAKADNTNLVQGQGSEKSYSLENNALALFSEKEDRDGDNSQKTYTKIKVIATAYSSTEWQTDDTPFITANGSEVRDGIIANNMLPFGTEIKLPELYGNKVFTVEDRMHSRKSKYQIDIWFPTLEEAKAFGVKETYIEVLEI